MNSKSTNKSALGGLLADKKLNNAGNRTPMVPPILQQVGKLAAGVASVKTDTGTGSATGNPRNKVALQPGHSLMDWIRLGASGKDLSGVGAKAGRLPVTKQELAKHCKSDDIWLAIRGKVYNVTAYLPFHPGGQEELMRGAGIDATRLFDQVHPWVNYDQILSKCLVGRLVLAVDVVDSDIFQSKKTLIDENTEGENNEKPSTSVEPSLPRFDWIQKLDSVTIIFYTEAFSNPMLEILPPNDQGKIQINIIYDKITYRNEWVFHDEIHWPGTIKIAAETGKVELTFKKIKSCIWENSGILKQSHEINDVNNEAKNIFVFKSKQQLTHNTFRLCLEQTDGRKIVCPLGKHIKAITSVDGLEIGRSYTPIPQSFSLYQQTTDKVYLMVKRYQYGQVSSYLTNREINDIVYLTQPLGNFKLISINKKEGFVMLAAGTGFTPMAGLLLFLLERRVKKCQFVRLIFFNRTEHDIPFREELQELSQTDDRFKLDHVLSEPSDDWAGARGHVNSILIENAVSEHIKDTGYTIDNVFFFVCGPPKFVQLTVEELKVLNVKSDQIHLFQG